MTKTYDRSRSIRAPPWQRALVNVHQVIENGALATVEAQEGDIGTAVAELVEPAGEQVRHSCPSISYPRPPISIHAHPCPFIFYIYIHISISIHSAYPCPCIRPSIPIHVTTAIDIAWPQCRMASNWVARSAARFCSLFVLRARTTSSHPKRYHCSIAILSRAVPLGSILDYRNLVYLFLFFGGGGSLESILECWNLVYLLLFGEGVSSESIL